MNNKKVALSVLIILAAGLSTFFAWSNSGGALRPYIIFAFLLICPGLSLIRLVRLNDFLPEWILAIALSLGLGIGLSEFMVLTNLWSPNIELSILAGISIVGAALQIMRVVGAQQTSEGAL